MEINWRKRIILDAQDRMKKLTVGAVHDRAYFVDSRKKRGHRPRLQMLPQADSLISYTNCRALSDGRALRPSLGGNGRQTQYPFGIA
jgi:hypothetical protein